MKAKPLTRYQRPRYPTKLEVLAHPEILARHIPAPWHKAEIAGIASLLLAANGCRKPQTDTLPAEPAVTTACTDQQNVARPSGREEIAGRVEPRNEMSSVEGRFAFVAPIFSHGEGRGVSGCVVVSPPVFLSEEEALQAIREELRQAGVEIAATNVEMKELFIEQDIKRYDRSLEEWLRRRGVRIPAERLPVDSAGVVRPLEVDGLSGDGKVAFEFVSRQDYGSFGGLISYSTVHKYDMPSVAELLAKQVAGANSTIYFGTFYDPLAPAFDADSRWDARAIAAAKQRSKSLLRAQVVDFVDWLKGQGAI